MSETHSDNKVQIELITERMPEQGLPTTGIRVDDLSGIPGVLPHWKGEIDRRKKEILAEKNAGFAKKASRFFVNKNADSITGAELLAIIDPNLTSNNSTKALSANPTHCDERAYLVSYILKRSAQRTSGISILQMRTLLLHSILANAFDKRSLQSLLAMYQTYIPYLTQLMTKSEVACQEAREGKYPPGIAKKIYLNRNMLLVYKIFLERRIPKLFKSIKRLKLDNRELKNFDMKRNNADETKNQMFRSAYYAVSIMRCFPLLQAETEEITNLVLKVDMSHPLGWFLKGHLFAANGEWKYEQDRIGYYSDGIKTAMVNDIKAALENYGQSLKAIPGNRYEGLNYNILAQYIHFILFVCRFIPAPRSWKATNLEKAIRTLSGARTTNRDLLVKMQTNAEELLENL